MATLTFTIFRYNSDIPDVIEQGFVVLSESSLRLQSVQMYQKLQNAEMMIKLIIYIISIV